MVTISNCDKPGTSTLNCGSLRGDARHSVAEKWAARKKKQQTDREAKLESTGTKIDAGLMSSAGKCIETEPITCSSGNEGSVATPSTEAQQSPFIPFCVLLQRSWKEVLLSFQRQQPTQRRNFLVADPTSPLPPSTPALSKRTSFPSVLSILQARALKQQVESFLHDEISENTTTSHCYKSCANTNHSITPTADFKILQPVLNILPADYDFQRAIEEMTKSRSRVFWLLDLAAIIRACITCQKHFKGQVQLAYRLHHNAHPKLLQLLHDLGVILLVATKYDLEVCERQLKMSIPNRDKEIRLNNHQRTNMKSCAMKWIHDDPSFTSKPNSFYRQLLLHGASGESAPIAVNGPQEVLRLLSSLESIFERRDQIMPELRFTLKLNSFQGIKRWQQLLTSTLDASSNAACHVQVVGIAVELPSGKPQEIADCLQRILSVLEYHADLVRGRNSAPKKLHLTLCNHSDALDSQVSDWVLQSIIKNIFKSITLDVSQMLVTDASALCTRIIGVKQTEVGKIHYYIDDGCYGSLSNIVSTDDQQRYRTMNGERCQPCSPTTQTRTQRRPVPLQPTRTGMNGNAKATVDSRKSGAGGLDDIPIESCWDEELLLATVWGPTCDGLDKVCSDIKLPRLCRDDWLVFADIGFCHVGTTFNGFAPPDIAFCVLGKGAGYYKPAPPTEAISV